MGKGLFVTATSTGIGKTVISAILCRLFSEVYNKVSYYKPVQTGGIVINGEICSPDLEFVSRFNSDKKNIFYQSDYLFIKPASPHLSASIENKEIVLENIIENYNKISNESDAVVVEGAGGLLVPLNQNGAFISDIPKKLNLNVALISKAGLGAINDVLLNLNFIRQSRIKAGAVVLLTEDIIPTDIEEDNYKTIKRLSGLNNIFLFPRINGVDTENYIFGDIESKLKYFPDNNLIKGWLS
ncbi:MAG: dethiobiotin synthase [Spirochaetes bacterium]|nr:dethiobiotin synthase [Spirochaetota bacterium]